LPVNDPLFALSPCFRIHRLKLAKTPELVCNYFDNVRLRRIFTLFLQPAGGRAGTIDEVLGHQLSG
jgi:hypothetical protein